MAAMLAPGTEIDIKFRVPLLQKGHQEGTVIVADVQGGDEGVSVATEFKKLDNATQTAVQKYAEDIAFLKSELRDATNESEAGSEGVSSAGS